MTADRRNHASLSTSELLELIRRVFRPRPADRALAVLVDLPDAESVDHAAWADRRRIAVEWWQKLRQSRSELGLEQVSLALYPNVHRPNADLPPEVWLHEADELPASVAELQGPGVRFDEILAQHQILIAPTEFSATAPLKLNAPRYGFRAATMPGFGREMLPALKLDFEEVNRRCEELKSLLDQSAAAHLRFEVGGEERSLTLDLRHRSAIASGGLIREPGTAGNLPSGETYIVPYEGELAGEPSMSRGVLPLELAGELLCYRIEANRAVEVIGTGPQAAAERRDLMAEPAYANIAELGFGLLADYGIKPIGQVLLDEKLGLHVAFGRSDHFGGSVGAKDFSSPERAVHMDRVYIPEVQPRVRVAQVELAPQTPGAKKMTLMRDSRYVRP